MQLTSEQAIHIYTDAYNKLYKRQPKDIRVLDRDWVVVNGARMRVTELEFMTHQLEQEYRKATEGKKNVVLRLISWLKQ
jgi:hypothetical protein